ncbi:transducin beta-like protein 3 [Stomoxys calcitrans]|uniref:transducin beta-like protein 3 n=1 Tax=Stomoxys calcitrans TaxID=35570 RepID=UPI0027E31E10|nr:transducin beta-like protein 3 [Stomoxys calcitrans]
MSLSINEKSYAVESRYSNFYSGGDVAWSRDGNWIFCLNGSEITKVDLETGLLNRSYGLNFNESGEKVVSGKDEEDDDAIYCFDVSFNQEFMVTVHQSSLLRLWHLPTGKIEKLWKSQHKGPVVKVTFSSDAKLVCTSGADSTLKIWDYENSRCVCALKDFTGPALLIKFHPCSGRTEIFAAGADNVIYKWDYVKKTMEAKMKGHLSQVTDIDFSDSSSDCENLISVGRDKVVIVWNLANGKQVKVIPLYEEIVGAFYIDAQNAVVAGLKGNIKEINCTTGKISSLLECQEEEYEIKTLLHNRSTQQLAVVTNDQNILIFGIKPALKAVKQLIGFNDEILDICFVGESEQFLAVATNSKHIKLYDIENHMNCSIIMGHKDTVMTLSSPGSSNLLLSAGKDFSIFLWTLDKVSGSLKCLTKNLSSHTATIGCISFGFNCSTIFASVCQSGSMKIWSLNLKPKQQSHQFSVKCAVVAHDKEVNSVTFSPNNKVIATASQDKTAKLWSADNHSIIGTLRGHTRGVWSVRFSPTDQIILTTSSDCSLRLWSLTNLSCLKRLEQTSTVLRAEFLDHGKYILSSGSDGLLKLWNIKTNACIQTLDEHEDRVWSLAVSARTQKYFFSAAADSKIIKWKDVTEEYKNSEIDKRQAEVLQEQSLQTLLHENKNLKKAFNLALKLGKPRVTYNILNQFIQKRDHETVANLILQLSDDRKNTLLDHVKVWSCNARYSQVSNVVLQQLLNEMIVEPSLQRSLNAKNLVEVVTPYVQRHFKRVTELSKELHFLDFIVQNI